MTAIEFPSTIDRRRRFAPPARTRAVARARPAPQCATARRLSDFIDAAGHAREVVVCAAAAGGLLVIDRDRGTLGDARLIAHLAADEPEANAELICRRYVSDPRRGRPRRVTSEDLAGSQASRERHAPALSGPLVDSLGGVHRLRVVPAPGMGIPELRWVRRDAGGAGRVVRLREVIGAMQSYEPAREQTDAAIRARGEDPTVSVAVLRAELQRVGRSRIVLNRGLREAVLRAMAEEGLSMSCIASRCGRVKRDRRGNVSGETSWLARRLGIAPEGGEQRPTPWIHSDVLALIARAGLGIAPREVELG